MNRDLTQTASSSEAQALALARKANPITAAIFSGWRAGFVAWAAGSALLCAMPVPAAAQAAVESTSAREFNLVAAPLAEALARFAEQAGVQMRAPAALTTGKSAPEVKGRRTADDALRQLLAGSGLIFAYEGANTVVITAAPQGANVLGAVRVEGAAQGGAGAGTGWEAGPNGSSDASATEGKKSYAATSVTMGDGSAKNLKDIAQSISVIGSKQMQEQALVSLTDVLKQSPGITLQNSGNGESRIFSRGREINKIQIDGGAAVGLGGYSLEGASMRGDASAIYDHVEVMRGAVGESDGFASPAGSVNLQRKRPLDQSQVVVDASYGSWADRRVALDLTGPVALDGKVRGRAVVSAGEKNFFFATANTANKTLYGIIEADILPSTMLTFGASQSRDTGIPENVDLPVDENGNQINLPRSTSYIPRWTNMDIKRTDVFSKLEHRFNQDWSAKISVSNQATQGSYSVSSLDAPSGALADGSGLFGGRFLFKTDGDTLSSGLTVNGKFELAGLEQNITMGYSRTADDRPRDLTRFYFGGNGWNLGEFNPVTSITDPSDPAESAFYQESLNYTKQTDQTAFVKLNALLTSRLHASLGLAWLKTSYSVYSQQRTPAIDIDNPATDSGLNLSTIGKETHFAPSLISLSYDLSPEYSVYGSVADAYSSNANSFIYTGPRTDLTITPTPADSKVAKPTTGENYEIGIKYLSPDKSLNASAAIFYLKQNDILLGDPDFFVSTPVFSCCSIQGGKLSSKGLELQVSGEMERGLQVTGGYTFNEVTTSFPFGRQSGYIYPPKHILTLWGAYQPQNETWNNLTFNAGVNYESKVRATGSLTSRFDADGNALPDLAVTSYRAAYTIFAAGVSYRATKNWTVDLKAMNLFDKVYYQQIGIPTGNYYGTPRSFKLALRGTF